MRIAVKVTLLALLGYALALTALAYWLDRQLSSATAAIIEDTAQLVGTEIARGLSDVAIESLIEADPVLAERLRAMVVDLTQRSEVVQSIVVVDRQGKVVASNEFAVSQQLAAPELVFEDTNEIRFLAPNLPLRGGLYHVFVPLMLGDQRVGYLRLSVSSRRIAELQQRARHHLLIAALTGLAGVAAFGFVFHRQITRRAAALARALEDAVQGAAPRAGKRDEFSAALDAAGRIGRQLSEERTQRWQAGRQLDAMAEVMNVGIMLLRADRQVTHANTRAWDLLGCEDGTDISRKWRSLEPTIDNALARQDDSSPSDIHVDVDVPSNEGHRRLRLELYPLDDNGGGDRLVLLKDREMIDTLETDLRLATQMRTFARLYTAVAHDLKAPLNAMVLNLELLKDTLQVDGDSGDNRDERQRYVHVLRDELARLNRVLHTLLSQTAQGADREERFDLRDLILDLQMLLNPQAQHQHVSFQAQVPDQSVPLLGYRDRLKQGLLNVALNALEAMPDGGDMAIQLSVEDAWAKIAIRDSGPGIAPEVLGRIYDLHFTTKKGGTGVGMYVARSVVESHGGEIRAESKRGKGTCFHINLPTVSDT